jgi:hypothetical protein
MLTGVGILELEAMEDVRSCFMGTCGTWIDVVSGDICDPMLYGRCAKLLKLVFNWRGDA